MRNRERKEEYFRGFFWGGVGVGTFNGSEVEDMAQERASSFFKMTLSVIQQRSVRV